VLTAAAAHSTPVTPIAVPGVSFLFPKEQRDSALACAAMAEFSMAYDQLHARSGPTSTGGASTGAGGQVNRLTPFRGRSMHATPEQDARR